MEAGGRPLVVWCLLAFAAARTVDRAIVAAPPGLEPRVARLAPPGLEVAVVAGGGARSESVSAALALAETELVAVHDAARPLVEPGLIDALVERLASDPRAAGAIAAAPLIDTVKRVTADGAAIVATEPRDRLRAAQTPQVFRAAALRDAFSAAPERLATATDESMLVEAAGGTVLIEPGSAANLKVTTEADLRLAEVLLARRGGRA